MAIRRSLIKTSHGSPCMRRLVTMARFNKLCHEKSETRKVLNLSKNEESEEKGWPIGRNRNQLLKSVHILRYARVWRVGNLLLPLNEKICFSTIKKSLIVRTHRMISNQQKAADRRLNAEYWTYLCSRLWVTVGVLSLSISSFTSPLAYLTAQRPFTNSSTHSLDPKTKSG